MSESQQLIQIRRNGVKSVPLIPLEAVRDSETGKNLRTILSEIEAGGVTIDTAMSDTSTNTVQNKVIKAYVDNKANIPLAHYDEDTGEFVPGLVISEGVLMEGEYDSSVVCIDNGVIYIRKAGYDEGAGEGILGVIDDAPLFTSSRPASKNYVRTVDYTVDTETGEEEYSKRWSELKTVNGVKVNTVLYTVGSDGYIVLPYANQTQPGLVKIDASTSSASEGDSSAPLMRSGKLLIRVATDENRGVIYDTPENDGKSYVRKNRAWVELADPETITVDTEMSSTSTNAVQNKVIKSYIDNKSAPVKDIKMNGNSIVDSSGVAEFTTTGYAEKMFIFNNGLWPQGNLFIPGVYYIFNPLEGDKTIVLSDFSTTSFEETVIEFSVGSSVPSITWPNVVWAGGSAPTLYTGKTYVVSFFRGFGVYAEFDTPSNES